MKKTANEFALEKEMEAKRKKIEDHEITRPDELSIFEIPPDYEDAKKYSNTIEIYDSIPKYYWGKQMRKDGKYLDSLKREFVHKGANYSVRITPARIQDRDGEEREYLPSQREELVEDALRKLATEGKGVFLDDEAGVVFTLYEVQKELERIGHGYKIADIKEAILILGTSNIELKSSDGTSILTSSFFEAVGLQTREDWKGHGKKTKAYIKFNSLVTKSISTKTFRQIDYDMCMSFKSVLARWLHKRMSHNFKQASVIDSYTIKLTTIIRDSGVKEYAKISNNARKVILALDEMKEKKVVLSYQEEKKFDGRTLVDIYYKIIPTNKFQDEIKKANARHKASIEN